MRRQAHERVELRLLRKFEKLFGGTPSLPLCSPLAVLDLPACYLLPVADDRPTELLDALLELLSRVLEDRYHCNSLAICLVAGARIWVRRRRVNILTPALSRHMLPFTGR